MEQQFNEQFNNQLPLSEASPVSQRSKLKSKKSLLAAATVVWLLLSWAGQFSVARQTIGAGGRGHHNFWRNRWVENLQKTGIWF